MITSQQISSMDFELVVELFSQCCINLNNLLHRAAFLGQMNPYTTQLLKV